MKDAARPVIGFTGYYGMKNFGDDLFGAICSMAAPKFWGGQPCLAGPVIRGVDAHYTMPRWYSPSMYSSNTLLGKGSRLYSFAHAIRRSEILVLGGGSIVNSRESFRKPLMLSAQRRGRLKLGAVGISIGPFSDQAAIDSAASFLKRFSYVAVRDARSYVLAKSMGLESVTHSGRDLAGLLPIVMPPDVERRDDAKSRQCTRIGVSLCNYDDTADYSSPSKRNLLPELASALHRASRRQPIEVEVFCLNGHAQHGDTGLSQDMLRLLKSYGVPASLVIYDGQSPLKIARQIGRCDAMISARLHGAIVAYMQGVPFTIVDYHAKCRDFADDVGLAQVQRITATQQDAQAWDVAIQTVLERRTSPMLSHVEYAEQATDIFRRSPWWTE